MFARDLFYLVKPLIPRRLQLLVRRQMVLRKRNLYRDTWPIDPVSRQKPNGWLGWPQNKQFALVLTHDVETARGQSKCPHLMELEKELRFRSSFNLVPERYRVLPELRQAMEQNGFEVGVHGLYHDGKLYSSEKVFRERATRINAYLEQWGATGFRSPSMLHNLDWLRALEIEYDASTFDTDPFEPQPDGMGVIFPFWVPGGNGSKGYVELPYTLAQDFTLFVLMKEKTIDIWKRKLDWIAENGGMALVDTHPDYMHFGTGRTGVEEYPVKYYREFLEFTKRTYDGAYWHVLPREMAKYWFSNVVARA